MRKKRQRENRYIVYRDTTRRTVTVFQLQGRRWQCAALFILLTADSSENYYLANKAAAAT